MQHYMERQSSRDSKDLLLVGEYGQGEWIDGKLEAFVISSD